MECIRLPLYQTKYYAPVAISRLYEHRESFLKVIENANRRRRYAISEKSGIKFSKIDEVYNNEIKKEKNIKNTTYSKEKMSEYAAKCPY